MSSHCGLTGCQVARVRPCAFTLYNSINALLMASDVAGSRTMPSSVSFAPDQLQLPFALWTRKTIQMLIAGKCW